MATDPARPEVRLTPEGRRVREVVSYTRRGGRFTPRQRHHWEEYADRWVLPEELLLDNPFDTEAVFGRRAPLVVEIGCGVGEATAALAATYPQLNVLAFEVWRPGVADALGRVAGAGAEHVRFSTMDAAWAFQHVLAPGSLQGIWTFFPDPWPKQRHHKRRLVAPGFVRLAAGRLAPGAEWRLSTDWPAYAEQMEQVLDAEPLLEGGRSERWEVRPITRFERRAMSAGRPVTDLCYRRTDSTSESAVSG